MEEREVEKHSIDASWCGQVVAVERKVPLVTSNERGADKRSIEESER